MNILVKTIIFILLGLLVINTDLFISKFGLSYYSFSAILSILLIIFGIKYKFSKIIISTPIAFFLFYLLWSFFQDFIISLEFNFGYREKYLFFNGIFLVISLILISQGKIVLSTVSKIVATIFAVECALIVFQYFNVVNSLNDFLPVTGSMTNPNFTAMYLALGLPMVLYWFFSTEKKLTKYILIVLLGLILIAFVLLQCRTAFIAVAISTVYILNFKYSVIKKLNSRHRFFLKGTFVISLIFIIITFSFYSKIDSTNSRLFIWKHTLNKAIEKPIVGHGLNSFIREYNLMQSDYFEKQKNAVEKKFFASHIRVAYNDYLQIFFELGFVGLFFYLGFIVILLFKQPKEHEKEGPFIYAGILTFAIMGLFNSVQFVIPIFSLFVLYAAFYIDFLRKRGWLKNFSLHQPLGGWPVSIAMVLLGSYISIHQLNEALSSRKLQECRNLLDTGKSYEALLILEDIKEHLRTSDDFWITYGIAYANEGKYELALKQYEKAKEITAIPVLYIEIGRCLYNLGQFNEAIYFCKKAVNMIPAKIFPKHSLMKVYKASGDTKNTIAIANEILSLTPKGKSEKAEFYKEDAQSVLRELEH